MNRIAGVRYLCCRFGIIFHSRERAVEIEYCLESGRHYFYDIWGRKSMYLS